MPWRSFRFRVALAFLTAGFLPVVLGSVFTLLAAEQALREQAIRMHRAVLDALVSGTELFVRERLGRLETLAGSPDLQGLEPARVARAAGTMLAEQSFVEGVALCTPQGRRIWESGAGLPDPAKMPSLAAGLARVVSTGVSVTMADDLAANPAPAPISGSIPASSPSAPGAGSELGAGSPAARPAGIPASQPDGNPREAVRWAAPEAPPTGESGDRGLRLLVPVFSFVDPGRVEAVLVAEARLGGADIQEILDAYPIRGEDYLCLLDEGGAIVARHGRGIPPQAERFAVASEARTAARTGIWTGEFSNRERTDLLSLSFSPVLAHWVAIGTPASEAFALAGILREHALVVGFLSLVLCGAAAAFLARSVSEPVRELIEGLSRVSGGEFSHRVNLPDQDELGQAGAALNALAQALQKKMAVGSIWERFRQGGPPEPPTQGT